MSKGLIGSLEQLFNAALIIPCHHLQPRRSRRGRSDWIHCSPLDDLRQGREERRGKSSSWCFCTQPILHKSITFLSHPFASPSLTGGRDPGSHADHRRDGSESLGFTRGRGRVNCSGLSPKNTRIELNFQFSYIVPAHLGASNSFLWLFPLTTGSFDSFKRQTTRAKHSLKI